jgi:2-polyprenyl-6-hydroxyphenyl methylase/3-demethylubiquinone-9 3-methyltransferase
MWKALENAQLPLRTGGKLFIAIYNDTGSQSRRWARIKHTYNNLPGFLRTPFALLTITPNEAKAAIRSTLDGQPGEYLRSWINRDEFRGMSRWRNIVDWVGGYPYEFAAPEQIFEFYRERGFTLTKLKCGGAGLGCNEFVFVKEQ